jgi:hypothetical protein
MGDVISKLDRLEEIIRALTAKVGDVDQQQQAFSIALIRLEQGQSADTPPPADPAQSATTPHATSGSSSVVPPTPNTSNMGHHRTFPRCRGQET